MALEERVGAFLSELPVALMARGLLGFAFNDTQIDAIFLIMLNFINAGHT